MKKIFVFLLFTIHYSLSTVTNAQGYKYWIQFTDKNGSPYSISTPSAYLSARAIARRTKYSIPVQYNDLPPNPNYIDSVIAKGVTLLNRSRWFNAISIYTNDTTKIAKIRALPFVVSSKYVTVEYPSNRVNKHLDENMSNHNPQNSEGFNYGNSYNQEHMIGVDCLNDMGFRGKGKRIAVIDTRFGQANYLTAFDSLFNRGGVLGTWDFVWQQPIVWDDTNVTDVHGQEVLSCMAGNLPGQLLGDAMDADYYLLRTEDAATENEIEDDNWASGAEYADSAGADVITSSLGYSTFDDGNNSYTYADMNGKVAVASRAATIGTEKGMVVCVAAGNEGGSAWQYITSPGDADSILTVGAVDYNGNYANFSSTGPTSDRRVKPDVVAQGVFDALADPNNNGVTYASGTSFATPVTAGAVASLWQADSNASNYQLMLAIKQSATQYANPDSLLGYGIPNYCLARTILTGITDNSLVTYLNKIYPDPFTDNITLSFFSSLVQNVNVKMYNTLGQLVSQKSAKVASGGNTLITIGGLQSLSNGVYIVMLTDEKGGVYTAKVVK